MAKANAFNRILSNGTNFPLSSATGNIPWNKLNSGTDATGSFWNGDANGVWARPLGGALASSSEGGLGRYFASYGINADSSKSLVTCADSGTSLSVTGTSGQTLVGRAAQFGSQTPAGFFNIGSVSRTLGLQPSIINGPGTIEISMSSMEFGFISGLSWNLAQAGDRYRVNNVSGRVVLTLPSSGCAVGTLFTILGFSADGWRIAQVASQVIHVGASSTTVGIGGSISSSNQYDSIEMVCVVANTEFSICGQPQSSGLTIV